MAIRKLKVYTGPDISDSQSVSLLRGEADSNCVKLPLGDILPLLADAVACNRTWLSDFEQDEVSISSDLYDVLQAYRHFRRPGA